jgi:hypothetical protein
MESTMTTMTIEIPTSLTYRAPNNGPVYTLDITKIPEERRNATVYGLLVHGYSQKIGDAAAGDKTDDDRHTSRSRVAANLQDGVWAEKGGARLDPVLVELRGLVVTFKYMKAEAARKATMEEIKAVAGAKFDALKARAEAIVALAAAPLDLPEPDVTA